MRCLRDRLYRKKSLRHLRRDCAAKWIDEGRFDPRTRLTTFGLVCHGFLRSFTSSRTHRFLVDRELRAMRRRQAFLLLLSPRYQAWAGHRWIERSIDRWQESKRINQSEADNLYRQLSGSEVRAYVRGFGGHLALKAVAPLITPIKYGGLTAFIATGNYWFLLPMLMMPGLRSLITLASWWSTRSERIAHGEAFLVGLLPMIGSIAFPLQMYSQSNELSTFLIRDAASKLGRRVPIYGGPNSRTEISMIQATDLMIELLDILSSLTRQVWAFRSVSAMERGRTPGPSILMESNTADERGTVTDTSAEPSIRGLDQSS